MLTSENILLTGMGHEETIPLNEMKDNNENESNGVHSPARTPGIILEV